MKIATWIDNRENHRFFLLVQKFIEEYLEKKGYLKVDLPVLSPALIPESYLEVFETKFIYMNKKERIYLTPSPELFLKRLLAFGLGDCFYLGKSFRNGDFPSDLHTFEFTILEIYKTNISYLELAEEILAMISYVHKKIKQEKFLSDPTWRSPEIKFDYWEKITVAEAFEKWAGMKRDVLFDHKQFLEKAKEKGYQVEGFSYEEVWSQIYVQEIEPNLGLGERLTLIYDYPKEFAALAKLNPDRRTAQRFEFYFQGKELGDCYTELIDWQEQKQRLIEEIKKRKILRKVNHRIDKGFLEALKYGLKPCSGIAIGVERLALVLLGLSSIQQLKLVSIINED
ncbi:MAG: hypothetical protein NZL96_00935 [Patescibacteria group bacterium]|nr:hypothetical protein [Patescibacteria group bacterium]